MKQQMMSLADGDVSQYNEIRRMSMEDYLVKMDSLAKRIEAARK